MEYPTLVVLDPSQADPADRTTIYFGAAGETELDSILYPDGPDGDPFLDPDTDGGDIMPDSVRIKEIHAALEAEKYGVHSQSTEENPLKRLNNLGRLIEAASYVLGVNFNEDGENVPYPDPDFFYPDKVEEINTNKRLKNAQFAVAEMGGKFDASALYQVRSAILKSPRTASKPAEIDRRPHAVKYHNLAQLMDVVADDNAKMLGGGGNAVFSVPSANGWQTAEYEGLIQAVADCLYMQSALSKNVNELQNQAIKTVYMQQQILKALGLPLHVRKIEGVHVVEKTSNEDPPDNSSGYTPASATGETMLEEVNSNPDPITRGYMPVPTLDTNAPTITSLIGIILMNLQRVVGASINFKETDAPRENDPPVVTPNAPTEEV